MSTDKVELAYVDGIPAMNNLINMIEQAIRNADIPFYRRPRSGGWNYRGFYLLDNREFWCGVRYSDHLAVVFETMKKDNYNVNYLQEPRYPVEEDRSYIRFRLKLLDNYFFDIDKDEQLEIITDFVNVCYVDFQRMRKY